MPSVIGAKNLTEKRFLNMYELEVEKRDGSRMSYYMATRAKKPEDMKIFNTNKGGTTGLISRPLTKLNNICYLFLLTVSV